MMCRDVAIYEINSILEDIHNSIEKEKIRLRCERFKTVCDNFEELGMVKEEIKTDRLKEYVRFFAISGICEYDIFHKHSDFYEVLEENLEESEYKRIREILAKGGDI